MRRMLCAAGLMALLPLLESAQMTTPQRLHDFENLVALYAKRYGPYEWKKMALGVDALSVGPWLARVEKAKDDLEFYEICSEYVASLNDVHSSFRIPSNFLADTGIYVDIYDGKVLVELINTSIVPPGRYPIEVGDEVVSVDGKSAEEWIAAFSRLRKRGNPLTTRRAAADLITYRPQSVVPRASELGPTARFVLLKASGQQVEVELSWVKSGYPLTIVGPVFDPLREAGKRPAAAEDPMQLLNALRDWSAPAGDHLRQGEMWSEEDAAMVPRRYLLNYGARSPVHVMPAGFQQRLGRFSTDFHFSGTYESEGFRIGFLRIPNFGPNLPIAMRELDTEIDFFQKNTDGLVVDVRRNNGGGCYMLDVARRLMPSTFYFFGEQYRPTLSWIVSLQNSVNLARSQRSDSWVIELYQGYLDQMIAAYKEQRGMTGPIPSCWPSDGPFVAPTFENQPAPIVYTKPIIFLIDEFSNSAADIFPAMMQDNRRGPMVGTRSNGGGGSTSLWPTGFYSESSSSVTNSLVVRKEPIVTPDYPTAPYIENIGVRPDIPLEYMTRENLLQRGRPFVDAFSKIVVEEIRKSRN